MEIERQASRKIFWGWFVVAGAFITIGINYGARYCFGVFLKPMCEELGWSRSIVSFAMSLYILFLWDRRHSLGASSRSFCAPVDHCRRFCHCCIRTYSDPFYFHSTATLHCLRGHIRHGGFILRRCRMYVISREMVYSKAGDRNRDNLSRHRCRDHAPDASGRRHRQIFRLESGIHRFRHRGLCAVHGLVSILHG
jgi:hypothetical protein